MKSKLRLIDHCAEFIPRSKASDIPKQTRGIYALLKENKDKSGKKKFNVVYIGMSKKGIYSRLHAHHKSVKKEKLWTHFSVYSVWPNITDEEITELEGLFRAIYRKDAKANGIAVQKNYKLLSDIRDDKFGWK